MALSSYFLAFVITLKVIALSRSKETCVKTDVCTCVFIKNGTIESIVSLWAVDGTRGPSFTNIQGQSGRTFDWNPCTPFDTDNGCKKTLVCEVMNPDKNAGTEDTTFSVNSEGNVVIAYGGYKDTIGYTRKSEITLKCDPSAPGKGTIPEFTENAKPETKTSLYSATFTSKFACPMRGSSDSDSKHGEIYA